jgi:hypothetical protein
LIEGNTTVDCHIAEVHTQLKEQTTVVLVAEDEKVTCIHKHLLKAYRKATADVSII